MGFRNPTVWLILILLIVLLFGASKLPDITRNIGKSLKIFKEEVRDLSDDGSKQTVEQDPPAPPSAAPESRAPASPDQPGSEDPPHAPKPPTEPR